MDRLIDYLFFVGPGRGSVFRRSPSLKRTKSLLGNGIEPLSTWHKISRPVPTILCHFPAAQHTDLELPPDVAYFCQPEGPCVQLSDPKLHVFMLTDTESNIHTYGICLSIPHLFDPLLKAQLPASAVNKGKVWEVNDSESLCIQEWGVLSVCILTRHPFYQFFAKCLRTLSHFVDHFGGKELNWNALIQAQMNTMKKKNKTQQQKHNNGSHTHLKQQRQIVMEVQEWMERLVALQAPSSGVNVLEVELEVDPAIIVCYPPPNRLPLFELSVHRLFQRLEVCLVIDIYKLVLSEEKVILHSHDMAFVSECVMTVMALLYPLQYLFPVIPLLPTSMPTAENLLMVPTPFFVGVCTSFMKKVNEVHRSETWIVDLDSKKINAPSLPDKPLLEFPFSILQLQADIRRAMDKLESSVKEGDSTPGSVGKTDSEKSSPSDAPPPNNTSTTTTTTAAMATATNQGSSLLFNLEDDPSTKELGDDVDVMIRIAFIEFIFSNEILGLLEKHLCVFRLFPRPVVSLKQVSFVSAYEKACPNTDKTFIKELIKSQCIEYFQEWSLNPSNYSFDEIRKGLKEVDRLSDKQHHFIHRMGVHTNQSCLYNTSPDSLLYQEMLSFKASQAFSVFTEQELEDDDGSDWEILQDDQGEYYDGGSETSPSSSSLGEYSDDDFADGPYSHHHSPYAFATTSKRILRYDSADSDDEGEGGGGGACLDGRIHIRGDVDLQHSDDEIEVGFHSRRGNTNPPRNGGHGAGGQPNPSSEDTRRPAGAVMRRGQRTIVVHPTLHPQEKVAMTTTGSSKHHAHPRRRRSKKKKPPQVELSIVPATKLPPPALSSQWSNGGDNVNNYPSSSLATSTKTSASCPKELMLAPQSISVSPQGGTIMEGYLTPTRRFSNGGIDVIPPSTSEDEGGTASQGSSPRHHRRHPLPPSKRYSFDEPAPLLHVPPLSGSSSSLEMNAHTPMSQSPSAPVSKRSPSSDHGSGVRNRNGREEDTDNPFANRPLGLTTTAGLIQTSRALENQIQDLVTKITEGQGLPWPKPAHLKKIAGYEKTRVMLLRQLEIKLRVRQPDELVMATEPQIAHVATTKAVFKGLQELLKYLLQFVEEELQKDSEASIFSVFLILRLAFSIHLPPPKQKTGGGFFSSLFGTEDAAKSPAQKKPVFEMESVVGSNVEEEYDGGNTKKEPSEEKEENGSSGLDLDPAEVHRMAQLKEESPLTSNSCDFAANGEPDGGGSKEKPSPLSPPTQDVVENSEQSIEFEDPLSNVTHSHLDGSPVRTIGSTSSAFSIPGGEMESTSNNINNGRLPRAHPIATPPLAEPIQLHQLHQLLANSHLSDPTHRREGGGGVQRTKLTPSEQLARGSPLRKGRAVSPSHQLLLELLASPRVYRPSETDHQVAGCVFLYRELMRSMGNAKAFLLEKKFWDILFMAVISTDRNQLGWNEKTTELYTRYNTLPEKEKHEFGLEEDNLLSIILHDLLVFMLMVGLSREETAMLIHRFAARIRLATSEEKLLQQTLKYIEQNASTELDLSSLGLLTLYSEVHPTISYIVHYGINVVAPVYKLQITSEALILRRFPDESITSRLWNDHVTEIECNKDRSTVTVRYRDSQEQGVYSHHFHTKQFTNVYESLLKLVPRLSN